MMLSQKARGWLRDAMLISGVIISLSSAYYLFGVTERYRMFSQAYMVQAQALFNQQAQAAQPAPDAGE